MQTYKNKRIAIFEYDWPMYHYIKDFAIKLAEAGFSVDIFHKDWDINPDYVNTNDFDHYNNVRFLNFTTKETAYQAIKRKCTRLINIIAISFSIPIKEKPENIIAHEILCKSKEIMGASPYYCLIGMEKKGLIWAGLLAEFFHWPLIYFSLELFIEDNPVYYRHYHLKDSEIKYHKRSIATIIQDGPRANALLESNGIVHTNILHFPVSAPGNVVREKSKYLHRRLHIEDNKKIILYFGGIEKDRFISEIVSTANGFDDEMILVLHGVGPKRYIKYLESIADSRKVLFSLDFIAENEIHDLISSADIGIALYKTTNANDRLVAFSSSKMADYAQCGIPIIAFDSESFRELVNSYRCAELIHAVNEIALKARKILDDYEFYREQAYAAYKHIYNLDSNFSKIIGKLERIIDSNAGTCKDI